MGKRRASSAASTPRGAAHADAPSSGGARFDPWLVLVVLSALLAFLPALRGDLVWDDQDYIRANESIRSLSPGSLAAMAASVQQGNYHPLTILSYAIDYAAGGLDPFGYHLVNLLLHAANALLVHRLVLDLSRRKDAAVVAAGFWSLHPLRVESVAWISGRKDLLYAAFFLIALLAYRKYARTGSLRGYSVSIASYLASLLSKGMATSLSLVLPLSDFLDRRPVSRKAILDKIPYLGLSLVFGIVAVWAQGKAQAIEVDVGRPILTRLVLAGYALAVYLGKTVWPSSLSALVPYPTPPGVSPPMVCYGLAALTLLVSIGVGWTLRFTRKIAFGFLFFLATTLFVLQLFPVGNALLADRYTYLSSVGLAYLVGGGYAAARETARRSVSPLWARAAPALCLAILACLGALTWQRCGVWRDSVTLWSDVVAKQPTAYSAFLNRANALADRGDREGARRDYDEAIRLRPTYLLAHYDKAYLEGEMGNFSAAVDGFSKALAIDPDMVWGRLYRGDAYLRLRRPADAMADYDRAISLAPELAPAYEGRARAWLLLRNREKARADAKRARELGLVLDDGLVRALAGTP